MEYFYLLKNAIRAESEKNFAKAYNIYSDTFKSCTTPKTQLRILTKMAWCQYQVGNKEETENIFSKISSMYPDAPHGIQCYADFLVRTGRHKLAKNILTKALERFPEQLELYLSLAALLKSTNRSFEAIEILKSALTKENLIIGKTIKRKDMWAELGSMYYDRNNYNSAIVCLKKSMRMGEENEFYHYDLLAFCHIKINDPKNALKYIDRHIKIYGDQDPTDYILKARIHSRLEELPEAASCILRAYAFENCISLSLDEMSDFSALIKNGFFQTLENVEFEATS
ncbi:MAG: hypothetical protein L6Q54_12305 [Leptospiraceae bacterium]|nr:hypothetical protein [Leptospiraceae bacterium]MCK6382014.1 hypothetical protein [Leptospiraceae bacterium]NUM40385.1 hypothetical protein [Leptospiraceae bacterium]